MNRQLTGVMADLHFSPTEKSAQNLLNEGKAEKIEFTLQEIRRLMHFKRQYVKTIHIQFLKDLETIS